MLSITLNVVQITIIKSMQLQLECNGTKIKQQICCTCKQQFDVKQARVILYDDQEQQYGELCSQCLHHGYDWIKQQFEQFRQFSKVARIDQKKRNQPKQNVTVSA